MENVENEREGGGSGKMKILLTGSRGQLGSECEEIMKDDYEIIVPDKEEFDITFAQDTEIPSC